jgi:DNA polymerase III epsilon subunit-like protein
VQISRRAWNIRPTRLSDVCNALDIALNHHEALSDANACAQIVLAAHLAHPEAAASDVAFPTRRLSRWGRA